MSNTRWKTGYLTLIAIVLGAWTSHITGQEVTDRVSAGSGPIDAAGRESHEPTSTVSRTSTATTRMTSVVDHPGVHLYTYGKTQGQIRARVQEMKSVIFGSATAATCYQGTTGMTAQLAIQTEARFKDFVDHGQAAFLQRLDDMVDALVAEGVATHLLLSVHDRPAGWWQGIHWPGETWPSAHTFSPFQPCAQRTTATGVCLYDVIFENFHRPVIEHLVATGRADSLALIYVLNEFDYEVPYSTSESWPGCADPRLCRNEALAYTTRRALDGARISAQSRVPIGAKFSSFLKPGTAYKPYGGADQLAYILQDVMAPNGFVVGYDAYWGDSNLYDSGNRQRLAPFLGLFTGGRFEIAEYGHVCVGHPGVFESGRRTSVAEMTGLLPAWPEAAGSNLFAFNATSHPAGCYALYNESTGTFFPGAQAELAGIWDQIVDITGSPTPCNATGCHTGSPGDWTYCSAACPCDAGFGDCDNDSECNSGLSCVHDVGANYGWGSTVDVCESTGGGGGGGCHTGSPGDWTYCSAACPCDAGLGDCDNDSECNSGLSCVHDVGANYGWGSTVDVCESPGGGGGGCHTGSPGDWTYCSAACPCGVGLGDCDNDSQCLSGLSCVHDVGANYGWGSTVDVCE